MHHCLTLTMTLSGSYCGGHRVSQECATQAFQAENKAQQTQEESFFFLPPPFLL